MIQHKNVRAIHTIYQFLANKIVVVYGLYTMTHQRKRKQESKDEIDRDCNKKHRAQNSSSSAASEESDDQERKKDTSSDSRPQPEEWKTLPNDQELSNYKVSSQGRIANIKTGKF